MSHSVLRVDKDNDDRAEDPITAPIKNQLVLVRPLGKSTWLANLGDMPVTARLVTGPVAAPSPAKATPPQLPSPDHAVAYYGKHVVDSAMWSVSEFVPGVSLDRLLGVAILTPAQATYIASAIFDGLADLHSAGLSHGSLSDRKVMVGTDGAVRLAAWSLASNGRAGPSASARSADLTAACAIVAELARNADRPVGRHNPGGRRLLIALERTGNGANPDDAGTAAGALADELAGAEGLQTGEALLRRQIAALSDAAAKTEHIDDHPPARAENPSARRAARTAAQLANPVQKSPLTEADFGGPRRRRMVWAVAIVVVILAGIGIIERHPISSFADRLLNRSTTTTNTTAKHHPNAKAGQPQAVPRFGPPAAGVVRKVSLHRTGKCTLQGACPVRVAVHVRRTGSKHHVSWRIVTFHRCTGRRSIAAHGRMVVPAGSTVASASHRLHFAGAHALGLVAVTHKPSKAASPALLIPARHASC